jgi:hypothetical protein
MPYFQAHNFDLFELKKTKLSLMMGLVDLLRYWEKKKEVRKKGVEGRL